MVVEFCLYCVGGIVFTVGEKIFVFTVVKGFVFAVVVELS